MLTILSTLFGSVLSGGATGLLGVVIQRWADYKNKQLDIEREARLFDQQVKLKQIDAEIMAQEYAAKQRIVEVETAGASDVADSNAFAKSYDSEPKQFTTGTLSRNQRWLMVVLDFFRGLIRPGLAVYLCTITTIIYMQAMEILNRYGVEALPVEEATKLVLMIVSTILYLTTTCILWYYGTRNKGKQPGT